MLEIEQLDVLIQVEPPQEVSRQQARMIADHAVDLAPITGRVADCVCEPVLGFRNT
jgi:hypothetical protein